MIPDITELNFPKKDGKQYATLTQATVNIADMGEKTITTQVKIDGDIVPDFSFDWAVEFQGEKYIMPLRIPQGAKGNESLKSQIDLTFQHWAIYQLKRWPFVTIQQIAAGTYLPDEEVATVSLNLGDLCKLFGQVLEYYYGGAITIDLNPAWQYDKTATVITISHTKIWNVLIDAFHDKYGVRWEIKPASDNSNTVKGGERYVIRVGYPTTEVDHIFEYGFEGGLLKVERQVQSEEIHNMLKGRGGETNIPFRYFKDTDPNNEDFRPDPDWVEELANIPFKNLMPATFRSYVQGWKAAHISKYPGYTAVGESNAYAPWAWEKGYTDTKFDPVEFVADEITINPTEGDKQVEILPGYSPYVKKGSSLDKYGPLPDTLDNNDDIYPTLQGTGLDIAVAVEQIESDDVTGSTESDARIEDKTYPDIIKKNVPQGHATAADVSKRTYFTVPTGKKANIEGYAGAKAYNPQNHEDKSAHIAELDYTIKVFNAATGEERSASGIPAGNWYFTVEYSFNNTSPEALNVTLSFNEVKITSATPSDKWRNTFDIWVKNIWDSTKLSTETDAQYAERVWKPVLGDREKNTAKVVFTSGALVHEDYEFTIVGFPVPDSSKTYEGEQSHWRITLAKSKAELEATGLYVPSTQKQGKAGDTFVLTGTEMAHVPYVVDAEVRQADWLKDQLGEVKEIKPTAVVTTDRVRLNNEGKPNALINQLRVGNSLRLFDQRFFNEEGKAYETLYLQSITYTYREPSSDDAALNPDVEIVLGNEYTTSANPVSMMQGEISALQRQVGSISNIEQIVRAVGDKLYLRKDGISDRSLSPTQFFSLLTSGDFRAGLIGGAGWGFFKDENGNWVLEADRVNVRQEMSVNTLVINQAEGRGGMEIDTAAYIRETTRVEETDNGYICYFDQKGGSVANLFHVDDVAYCNQWTPENSDLKFYKRRVIAVGADYVTLTKPLSEVQRPDDWPDCGVNGTGIPAEGDNIIHYGNYTDKTRQYVKVRDVVGGGYERYIEGLDSVNATGDEYYFVGRQSGMYNGRPRFYLGDSAGYVKWENGKLVVKGSISSLSTLDDGTTLGDAIGGKIEDTDVLYITHTSATSAPALPTLKPDGTIANYNGWQTTAPTWQQGRYIWQTTYVRKGNGTAYFAATACISGRDGAGYSNNLLRNSDFHDGARYFTPQVNVTVDTGMTLDGRNSLKNAQSGHTSNKYLGWCYDEDHSGPLSYMAAKPGDRFTVSAWVYTEDRDAIDNGCNLGIYFRDANGRLKTAQTDCVPSRNGEWQHVSLMSAVAPEGTTMVEFRAGIVRNGTIWFNGIKAEYGANPNPVWTPYAEGVGIASITEQYYLSTSRTALTGGSWSDTRQPWVAGRYYWTRSKITYTDGKITYTDGVCVTGEAGTSILARYSADGNTGWHTSPLPDDRYMQTSTDGGATWSPAYLISASGYTNNLLLKSGESVENSHYNVAIYNLSEKPIVGKTYTLTLWGELGDGKTKFQAYNSGGSISLANLVKASDGVYSAVLKWRNNSVNGTVASDKSVYIYATPSSITTPSRIDRIKLEEGDNPTPVWTPAASEMQGGYPVFQWAKNSDASTAPTSGWQNTPLTALPGEYVWIRTGVVIPPATAPATWDPAVRLTGDHGADGSDVYRLDLSNEMAGVVCDADGNVTGAYPACTAKVYKGATLLTGGVTYSIPQKTGITTATISTAGVITLGGLTADKAEITVRAVTAGLTLESVMTVYKVKPGKDGDSVTVSSTSVTYQASANGTNTPTGTWLSAIPTVPAGQYLWTRTIVTYSDGKSTTTYSVSRQGADGLKYTNNLLCNSDFKDGTRFYQLHANVTLDTSRVLDGRYSVKSSQSGSTTQTYAGLIYHDTGKTGDFYPAKPGDRFTLSVWTYTDDRDALNEGGYMEIWFRSASGRIKGANRDAECKPTANGVWQHFHCISAVAPEGTISVEFRAHVRRDGTLWFNGMKAEYGSNDNPVWTPYAEGVTIASKSVTYARTTTATQPSDAAFTAQSIGALGLGAGDYMWVKTEVTYSDGTATKSYNVSRVGTDGTVGQPGPPGDDGKTSYVHFAYASGITGSLPHPASVTDFRTTAFAGAKYIGVCTDYNQADPITDVGNTYEWSEYRGADAVVYQIEPSVDKVVRDFDGTLSPTLLTCSVYKTTGASARTLTAEKTLKYQRLPDGLSGTLPHISGVSAAVQLLATTEEVVFELYDGTTLLDHERVPVLTDARDIELGGQNLLKNTNRGPMGWQTAVWNGNATAEQTGAIKAATAPDGKGVLMTLDGGLNEDGTALYDPMHTTYQAQYAVPAGTLEGGRRYVLSLLIGAVTGPAYLQVSLNRKGFSSVRVNYLTTITAPTSPDEMVRLEIPFTTPSGTTLTSGEVTDEAFYKEKELGISVYIRPKSAADVWQSFTVRDMQLERGNVATAYRPHINDTSYLVEALPGQTKFNGGLGLTSRILLGEFDTTDPDNPVLETIRAGINGVMMPNERGGGMVWWGGGSPKDTADYPDDDDAATSATRMDGTAYFAGNTVRFGKNFAEIGDSLRLDDDGLKLIKDNEVRLRVTDASVENFAQPTQEAVITIPAVTLSFRFETDLDDNAYGPHVLRAITGGEHITLGGGREVPANSAFDLGLSFELNAPQATFIPQFEVYVDLYNSAGALVSRTMCEQTRSKSTPAGITIRFTASVHTTLPKGSYWMRLWRGSANLPDQGAMLSLSAPVAAAGGITPGLKNCTILAPDGFLTTWNQAVILAKKDRIMLRVGSSSVIINDSMCSLISHNYGFRVSIWGIMKTTAYDPNNDGANWVITDK